jgi:uncharacterized membrane-anchored protein YitT (DUF2179 family)
MEIISVSFLQNSEGSISDGFDFLAFTLQSLLSNVKPYPVSNLELMINLMLVMPSIILCLTLVQLFPNFLVYLSNPLNEIASSILCSLFIHIDIFPIHQVQRNLW